MEVRAVSRYIRISPQKCRLVADQVRSLPVGQALELLQFSPKKAASPIRKTLESAIANAEHRATPIIKRTSHITVAVSDENGGED